MSDTLQNNPKVKSLLNKGKSTGSITFDEILKIIPDAEYNVDALDELYGLLLEEKIDEIGRAHV